MSSIYDMFNIGKLGIMAQQNAMQVTAHNIANVYTEGYSRQEVVFTETTPVGGVGTGVDIAEIRRKHDSFVERQITDGKESYGNYFALNSAYTKIEDLFYNSQGNGIDVQLNEYFKSWQDLSANPSGTAERITVISKGDILADSINNTHANLTQLQKDMNSEISQTVNEINDITSQIAMLNEKISQIEAGGENANDYRDMRGKLLNDLAEKIDIQFYEDNTGQITVMAGGVATLVDNNSSWDLELESNPDNSGYYNIMYSPDGSTSLDLTDRISGGQINGLLTIRDSVTVDVIDKLDRFAASLANEMNRLHRSGYALDGSTGLNFFTPAFEAGDSVSSVALSSNSGTGNVSVVIVDPSQLTFQNYTVTFSGGNYTITNTSANTTTTGAYTDPDSVTFEGLTFTISGSHADGDTFNVSAHKDAAKNLQVAIDDNDYDMIAAASGPDDIAGDNGNALLIAQLQDQLTIDGTSSFGSYYGTIVGEIGVSSQSAGTFLDIQEYSLDQLTNIRESVSGVSLDEEMTNLIKYQSAYDASAKLISIGDELLQTLIGLVD